MPPTAAPDDVLPLHLCLAGRRVLVVGGGPVAARKVAACLAARADVLVVAPYACEQIVADAAAGLLTWSEREYLAADLDGAWLAFAATGDRVTDEAVERHASGRRIFCVRADDATAGTARSPAVVRRDDLVISVGSVASAEVPADPGRTVAVRNAIAGALDSGSLPLRRHRPGPGRVVLVGAGPGDADLLTLRGRRELAAADVVVVDRLAPQSVLDELAPGVLILDVGKAPGRHPVPQHEINRLLIEHAKAGRRVVRLKGGDPFVLGRGGEEVAACRREQVPVDVVPGVTSAFSVPAAAGIPVTHRGLSRQVTVLSGHDALSGSGVLSGSDGQSGSDRRSGLDGQSGSDVLSGSDRRSGLDGQDADVNWGALACGGGTLVVLMGVAALPSIAARLLGGGMAPSTPVAIIENGWAVDQRVTTGTVADIADRAVEVGVSSPAVIVIGDVAALAG